MRYLLQKLDHWPGFGFALTGGMFALLYVLLRPIDDVAAFFAVEHTFTFALLLVAASSVSAFLVGTILWNRFASDGSTSFYRPAVVGAFVGILSMPLTMYAITVSRYLFIGLPENLVIGSPPPGMTQWTSAGALVLQDITTALFTSLFGIFFTGGLPILIGAATGEAIRRLTKNTEETPQSA